MSTPLRALLIDDSEQDVELLVRHLRRNGFEVSWARVDTADALRAALGEQEWDIALCDYVLPGFSGLAALEILRAAAPDLPVIVVTGQVGEEYAVEVTRAGARDYVRKDNLSRLVPAIERELADAEVQSSRKRAEGSLRSAELWLRLAAEGVPIGVFDYDPRTQTVFFSAQWKANLGYAADEIPDRFEELESRLHPDDHDRVIAEVRAQVAGGRPFTQAEFRLRHRDGSYRWFLSQSTTQLDASGAVFRVLGCDIDITERKRTEEAVRRLAEQCDAERQQLAAYSAAAPMGMFLIDRDLRYVRVNEPLAVMNGRTVEAHVGRSVAEVLPDLAQIIVPHLEAVLGTGEPLLNVEMSGAMPDDSATVRSWSASYFPLKDAAGEVWGVGGFVLEITQRKLAEAEMRALSETRERERHQFEVVLAHLAQGVLVFDADGMTLWANPAALRLHGVASKEELLPNLRDAGMYLSLWYLDGQPMPFEELPAARAFRGETVSGLEFRVQRHDTGREWAGSCDAVPIRDASGAVKQVVVTITDIGERIRAEAALRDSERRFRELAEALPNGVFTMLPDGRCDYINQEGVDWTGVPGAELLGTGWLRQLHPDDREAVMAAMTRALAQGTRFDGEGRLRRADGVYRWFTISAAPFRAADGAIVKWLGSATDIDDHKRLELEIRQFNAELAQRVDERTAQLQAAVKELEAFNYSVSHDLRAPLRHIDGFIGVLEEDYAPQLPETARQYLDRVRAGSGRMERMIEALLRLSRVGRAAIQPRRCDLAGLARSAFADLRREDGDRAVELVVGVLPEVVADPILMRQLLDNLLSNALKFTRPVPMPRIEVGSERREDHEVFYVRDNGVGFDTERAETLFGVFQRFHPADEFEGTGVGLSIVKRIVERHGGRVWTESAPGEGATFWFTLGPATCSA